MSGAGRMGAGRAHGMRAILALSCLYASRASMYDVVESSMSPPSSCALGCARWSDLAGSHNTASQAAVDALWASAAAQAAAGTSCAMPANFAGQPEEAALRLSFDFSFGPQCYCAGSAAAPAAGSGYCEEPAAPFPQQVNLQHGADERSLSVNFVTFGAGEPPLVELCGGGSGGGCANFSGTTAVAPAPQAPARVYAFHEVPLPAPLPADATYTYRVRGAGSAWRGPFTFRTAPAAAAAPTSIVMAGDLGIYPYAPLANFLQELAGASAPRLFLHLGDHSYNLAMGGGARGDGYMIGLQPVLSQLPMLPVFGNHELEASPFGAYCPAADACASRYTHQFASANRTGAASGSRSSLYYSIDVGLLHIIVLDTMSFIGLASEASFVPQRAWLAADLAAAAAPAQRARVPWILVATHVPMYSTGSGNSAAMISAVEPLLLQAGVDLFAFGHDHFYQSNWPVAQGKAAGKSFVEPRAPVHVLSGAGAAPAFGAERPAAGGGGDTPDYVRATISRWSYSRLTAHNASHLSFQQVDNINGTVLDAWTIVQHNHGPFAVAAE